jgi:hypothetical protein
MANNKVIILKSSFKDKKVHTEHVFAFWAAVFLSVSTIGFLCIQGLFGKVIERRLEEHDKLIATQAYANSSFEKAKGFGDWAAVVEMHENTLRVLNAPGSVIARQEEIGLSFNRDVYINTVQTLGALGLWDANRVEKEMAKVGILTSNDMNRFLVEQTYSIVEGSHRLGEKVAKIKQEVRDSKNLKDNLWYFFFLCQSIGLILGLVSAFVRKS